MGLFASADEKAAKQEEKLNALMENMDLKIFLQNIVIRLRKLTMSS